MWGIGHSGAAVVLASADPRAKTFVLVMPAFMRSKEASGFPTALLKSAWDDRAANVKRHKNEKAYVRVWPESEEDAVTQGDGSPILKGIEMWEFIDGALKRPNAVGPEFENK